MPCLATKPATACLTDALAAEPEANGRIHSVFANAVNIALHCASGGNRLLTVVAQGEYLPDSLQVAGETLDAMRQYAPEAVIRWTQHTLQGPGMALAITRSAWTGKQTPRTIPRGMILQGLREIEPMKLQVPAARIAQVRRMLRTVIAALAVNQPQVAREAARKIVGLGNGLTPSADDALTGVLAVLWSQGSQPCFLTDEVLRRTTDISAKYLHCAQNGYFSKRVLDVFDAAGESPQRVNQALRQAAQWGASSGMDMLWGMKLALEWMPGLNDDTETE